MDNVVVKVTGKHLDASGEESCIEFVSVGTHYCRDDVNYVLYDDKPDEGMENIKTLLKFTAEELTLIRRGSVTQDQLFRKNFSSTSEYITPYGKILITVTTSNLAIDYGSVYGNIVIDYALSINGRWQSDNHLEIGIAAENVDSEKLN